MQDYLLIAQIIVPIFLIVLILMQQGGSAMGSAFGQEGGFYGTKRGIQQKIVYVTIVFGALFILLAILNLLV